MTNKITIREATVTADGEPNAAVLFNGRKYEMGQ